jgi:CopG family nickel-responsive transcriptional regulator
MPNTAIATTIRRRDDDDVSDRASGPGSDGSPTYPEIGSLQRVTLTFDDELMAEIDRFMESRGYSNRSEAVRDLARAGLAQGIEAVGETRACVATLTYVFDPETRELARRLAAAFQSATDLRPTRVQRPLDGGEVLEIGRAHV